MRCNVAEKYIYPHYDILGFCVNMNANLDGSFYFSKMVLLEIFVSTSELVTIYSSLSFSECSKYL
jgi:hypothetical protein